MFSVLMSRRRAAFLGLGLTLVACALALLSPAVSEAIPCGYRYTYYSSPSYTTAVGVYGHYSASCGCGDYSWGTTSGWARGQYINYCDDI